MNISLGIVDVLANAVPGSLYVLLTLYASVRLGWVDLTPGRQRAGPPVGPDTTAGRPGAGRRASRLGRPGGFH